MSSFTAEIILLFLCVSLPNFVSVNSLEDKGVTDEGMSLNTVLDVIRKRIEFNEKCQSFNLNISVVSNYKNYAVDVSFAVSHPKYADCFEYYNITLRNFKKKDEVAVMVKYNKLAGASHRFKNVECGRYKLTIQACSSDWTCYPYIINYPELVNMTGIECLEFQVNDRNISPQDGKKVIVIITVVSVLLILAVSAVSFCFYWSAERKCILKDFFIKKKGGTVTAVEDVDQLSLKNKDLPSRNEVIILHRYDDQNNARVQLLQNFLHETNYYESVTTVEYSLSKILFDVNKWLDKMLETSKADGAIRKIILIASESDTGARNYELENLLFSKFLDKINDDLEKCLKGYNHLYVVQFEQLTNKLEEFRNIVRRDRYTLSGLFEDQLVDLCLNLCSESEQNVPHDEHAERHLRLLFSTHSIRCLENTQLDV